MTRPHKSALESPVTNETAAVGASVRYSLSAREKSHPRPVPANAGEGEPT
jgi:hypothetical protein